MAVPTGCRLAPIEHQLLTELALHHRDVPGLCAVRFFAPISGTAVLAICLHGRALVSYESPARDALQAEQIQRSYLDQVLQVKDLTGLDHQAGIAAASLLHQLRIDVSSEPPR